MGVKRLLNALTVLLIAIAITGCGDDEKTDGAGATGPTASSTIDQPTAATGATGATGDESDASSKDDSKDKGSRDDDDDSPTTDSDTDGAKDNSTSSDDEITPVGVTPVQFLMNGHKFVGQVMDSGRFKGKTAREVAPSTTVQIRIAVFDRGKVRIRVTSPNGKTRVYAARKLKRLSPLRKGQFYELEVVKTGAKAYIHATEAPRLVGPAG